MHEIKVWEIAKYEHDSPKTLSLLVIQILLASK